eukprot:scaffold1042_cov345-Pavlova_lutheri.AAC.6
MIYAPEQNLKSSILRGSGVGPYSRETSQTTSPTEKWHAFEDASFRLPSEFPLGRYFCTYQRGCGVMIGFFSQVFPSTIICVLHRAQLQRVMIVCVIFLCAGLCTSEIFEYNCSDNERVEMALHNPYFVAKGVKKYVFGIRLDSKPYVLKSGDFGAFYKKAKSKSCHADEKPVTETSSNKRVSRRGRDVMKEFHKLIDYKSPGLARVHGYCNSPQLHWLLLEPSYPLKLPLPFFPSCSQLFHLVQAPSMLFAEHNKLSFSSDVNINQFAVTPDWRILLADLDILVSTSRVGKYRNNATICTKWQDCIRDNAPVHKPRQRLYMSCETSCVQGSCSSASTQQLITCIIGKSVIGPLSAHYIDLSTAYSVAVENPQARLENQAFLQFLEEQRRMKCMKDVEAYKATNLRGSSLARTITARSALRKRLKGQKRFRAKHAEERGFL